MAKEQTERPPQIGVSVGLPQDIVKSIDIMRGYIPRAAFLRNMIIDVINKSKNNTGSGLKNGTANY